jgi:RND family efflux transporter MFP subunit
MFSFLKKRKLILLFIFFAVIGFFAYQKFAPNNKNIKIDKATVTKGPLEEKLTVAGKIDANEKVSLRFQTGGQLSWVGVKEGDYVKKYQVVASLDQRILQKTIEKYLNDYMTTRWNFEQTQDNYSVFGRAIIDVPGLSLADRRQLDLSQFGLNKSVLDVEIQDLTKKYANLWTPIEGIITTVVYPYSGVNVSPLVDAYTVINPNTVFFSVNAEQTDVTKLYVGMPGEIVLDPYPDKKIVGTIANISFTPDTTETGTVYTVKFTFNEPNTNYAYRVGMTGDASFVTKRKDDVLYIPSKFIKEENSKKFVYTDPKKTIQFKKYVDVGIETDTDSEITSGLQMNDVVFN